MTLLARLDGGLPAAASACAGVEVWAGATRGRRGGGGGAAEGGAAHPGTALQQVDVRDENVRLAAALVQPQAVRRLALRGLHVARQVRATRQLHLRLQQPWAMLGQQLQHPAVHKHRRARATMLVSIATANWSTGHSGSTHHPSTGAGAPMRIPYYEPATGLCVRLVTTLIIVLL